MHAVISIIDTVRTRRIHMNENLVEMVAIIDRSGSMSSIASDTIGGYNTLIEEQKKEDGEVNVTLALFDHEYSLVYDNVDIKEVDELTSDTYVPRGMTALYDAIGRTVTTVGERLAATEESERPFKVIVTIITDGQENSSNEYTCGKIKEMIELQESEYSWEFMFLAANMDAMAEGASFGIRGSKAMTFTADAGGMDSMMKSVSMSYSSYRDGVDDFDIKDLNNSDTSDKTNAINLAGNI
jgi:uncharacterized protein YegL